MEAQRTTCWKLKHNRTCHALWQMWVCGFHVCTYAALSLFTRTPLWTLLILTLSLSGWRFCTTLNTKKSVTVFKSFMKSQPCPDLNQSVGVCFALNKSGDDCHGQNQIQKNVFILQGAYEGGANEWYANEMMKIHILYILYIHIIYISNSSEY